MVNGRTVLQNLGHIEAACVDLRASKFAAMCPGSIVIMQAGWANRYVAQANGQLDSSLVAVFRRHKSFVLQLQAVSTRSSLIAYQLPASAFIHCASSSNGFCYISLRWWNHFRSTHSLSVGTLRCLENESSRKIQSILLLRPLISEND